MGCSKVRPLFPAESSRTLAHRLGGRVDRLRQRLTRFGLRPYRIFLVWTQWGGEERGEGDEVVLAELEILPTPNITDMTAVMFNPYSAGVLPVGSIRVDRISSRYPEELLVGKVEPAAEATGRDIREPFDFFWEVTPDDRGEYPAPDCTGAGVAPTLGASRLNRRRYRLLSNPFRRAGQVDWTAVLERASEDRSYTKRSNVGTDE